MHGSFLADPSIYRNLSLTESMWHCCALRLAIVYNAPLDVQTDIISKGTPHLVAAAPLIFGTQWEFYVALTLLRASPEDSRIEQAYASLRKMSGSESRRLVHCRVN